MSQYQEQDPQRGADNKRSNPFGFVLMAGLLGAWLAAPASANEDAIDGGDVQSAVVIEEIVVLAKRRPEATPLDDDAAADSLEAKIARDVRRHADLVSDDELQTVPSLLTIDAPRVHWGYEPSDDAANERQLADASLPLDIVAPATLFRVDF